MFETITNAIEAALKNSVVNLLKWIFSGVVKGSYWMCLVSCLIALICYIAGQRKAGKYVSLSFILYVIIQALKGALM